MILLKRESENKRNKKGNPFMKKTIMLSGAAILVMLGGVGCAMCKAPIPNDPNCIEDTHLIESNVKPIPFHLTTPVIVQPDRQFRPVFRAGAKVTGTGEGLDEKAALYDAIKNIMTREKCDYIVAVTRISTSKTHPTWRFFSTTNYMVTISGIPVYLEKLVEEPINKEDVAAAKAASDVAAAKAASNKNDNGDSGLGAIGGGLSVFGGESGISGSGCPCGHQNAPAALIRLTDIKVDVQAKGVAADDAGVIFPLSNAK